MDNWYCIHTFIHMLVSIHKNIYACTPAYIHPSPPHTYNRYTHICTQTYSITRLTLPKSHIHTHIHRDTDTCTQSPTHTSFCISGHTLRSSFVFLFHYFSSARYRCPEFPRVPKAQYRNHTTRHQHCR